MHSIIMIISKVIAEGAIDRVICEIVPPGGTNWYHFPRACSTLRLQKWYQFVPPGGRFRI